MIRVYRFHGITISVDSDDSPIPEIFEKLFGLEPVKQKIGKTRISLIFRRRDKKDPVKLPKTIVDKIRLIRESNIKGFFDGRKLLLTDFKSTVEINYHENSALFFLDPSMLKYEKLFSHTLLPLTVAELLKKYGFYYVHASCADIGGKGVLFLGGPGAGKSTSCYSLVRSGAKWVSDDAVLIRRRGKNVFAYSFMKEFSLKSEQRSPFIELRKIKGKKDKIELGNINLIRSSFELRTNPKIAVLLHGETGTPTTSFSRVSRSSLLSNIISENPFIFLNRRSSGKILSDLTKLGRQCNIMILKDKELVLDSEKFKTSISNFF